MSKLQHTSGPWKECKRGDYSEDFDKQSQIIIGDEMRICAVHSYDIESEANAHLIAAAPEMLEALITTYKAFNTDGHEHDCGQPCEGCECFSSCPNITVKQAIEKATGMSIEEILK
jgi:hypothetical protein